MDSQLTSKNTYDANKLSLSQRIAWWKNPGKFDIKGVDDGGSIRQGKMKKIGKRSFQLYNPHDYLGIKP